MGFPSKERTSSRRDAHNTSVDIVLVALGRCGQTHLATGRVCGEPGRHSGPCDFVDRDSVYALVAANPCDEHEVAVVPIDVPLLSLASWRRDNGPSGVPPSPAAVGL